MNVLLLTPRPYLLTQPIIKSGDDYEIAMGPPDVWPEEVDFIVSFGYRHKIKEPQLSKYRDRMINIHISMLPWNRGADPNFWSWFDNTPKGVSVHLVDKGWDTGNVIMQMEVTKWREAETLKSSYDFLTDCASKLFALEWERFRSGDWFVTHLKTDGSYHRTADKEQWMAQLPLGWDTPVKDVVELGELSRAKIQ